MSVQRVLLTGAAGYIGQAVAQRLLRAGHVVTGLVRSDVAAATVRAQGVIPVRGDLDNVADLGPLTAYDAVIDTATADHAQSTTQFLELLAGTGKTYIRTSGTGVYTDMAAGRASEVVHRAGECFDPAEVVAERYRSDLRVAAAASAGVRTIVIRPSMIHGDGASEQLPLLIRTALQAGESIYVAEGENRWANVFLADLADVYARALDAAPPGSIYDIAAGELPMRRIAEGVGELTGVPARSATLAEAHAALGERWVDVALASNSRVDSAPAREELGWQPTGPALLDDLVRGSYRRLWAFKADPHDHVAAVSA
ncbi:NAD-dependent epimerase/dehydratase family protein [Nakamurella leprariae]|uniref:NAD-dependent epimerase/dehydratase family protein n=1 Tax=Nakamurella leprariae TaxID=2803911 RepID=A0A938YIM4_9ACTN|nr:NAD-dependent epimerase/dehydratase family protein [Nakamurella leprariae]MBM9468543.1 NAD-dependent epimerase/dehydratase family protein [Nakamurella leprariae]